MAGAEWQRYFYIDPKNPLSPSQVYMNRINEMGIPDNTGHYDVQYHHSMLDDDTVNDSIKVKILYNELMKLKIKLANTERSLIGEINDLNLDHRRLVEENTRLSNEITSIKQALYFG